MRLTQEAFLARVAQDGMLEREAGRLALERSGSPEVRSFAAANLRDRARLSEELIGLAAAKGIDLPSPASAEGQMRVGKLWRTTGPEFDAHYVKRIGIEANKASIALFGRAARELDDSAMRAFIAKNMPTLRQHLETGERLLRGAPASPSGVPPSPSRPSGVPPAPRPSGVPPAPSRPSGGQPEPSPPYEEETRENVPMAPIDPPFPAVTPQPILCLRWSAIFAGIAMGATAFLALALIGIAGGLAVLDTAQNAAVIAILVAVWASASLALASFVGGAVAAFASGLRRASDGVLHGAVAWAASMIFVALAAIAAVLAIGGRSGLGMLLLTSAPQAAPAAEIILGADAGAMDRVRAQLRTGNRVEAVAMLQRDFGITAQQANTVVNRLSVADSAGDAPSIARKTWDTVALALGWLFGTMLLSLGTALGGGALGVKGHKPRVPVRDRELAHIV